ncbi:MAG: hypothetical protein M1817_006387 [Caeruleum heppii]|nr:MAG: hypothetical protein M1817_006387 [Caeruleum heppii]
MAEDVASPTRPKTTIKSNGSPSSVQDDSPPRHRPLGRVSTLVDSNNPRRSSLLSDLSLEDAQHSIRSSTDDLLMPKARGIGQQGGHEPSLWHSSPLIFALLPAVGGLLFQNGSAVITDVTLLALAAIFLNWSVRLPWDWYQSAQTVRIRDQALAGPAIEDSEDEGDEKTVVASETSPETQPSSKAPAPLRHHLDEAEIAASKLHNYELLALFACFSFPMIGAYILHTIRGQLSRPSEGLVSDYNLTIFLLAAEIRPLAHLARLFQARTLYLQRVVNENPYDDGIGDSKLGDLNKRLQTVEARLAHGTSPTDPHGAISNKKTDDSVMEVRRTLQPDLDALNRAVRRYEKRATLQTMQTESRLQDLEARLSDALSLAAAAAQSGQRQRPGFAAILINWLCAAVVLPVQAIVGMMTLPAKVAGTFFTTVRYATAGPKRQTVRKNGSLRHSTSGRMGGDRLQAKVVKRTPI